MWTPTSEAWTLRGASLALWALAAASAVYWGLKLGGGGRSLAVPEPPPRPVAAADPVAIATLLGGALGTPAAAPVTALATRFQLMGVVAEVQSGGGAAVISVDGRPARSFRVGASVDEGVMLRSVQGRRAVLSDTNDRELVTLEVPLRGAASAAATATPDQPPSAVPAAPSATAPTRGPMAAPAQAPGAVPPRVPMPSPAQAPTAAPR